MRVLLDVEVSETVVNQLCYPARWCCIILTLLTGKEPILHLEFNDDVSGRHGWFIFACGQLLRFSSTILKTSRILRESGDVAVISASSSNTTCWNRVNHNLHKCSPWKAFVYTPRNNITTSDLHHCLQSASQEPLHMQLARSLLISLGRTDGDAGVDVGSFR